jgi:NADH dehydrogenase
MGDGTHRVVVVGSGFGGLFATRFLQRAPVEVTLVDRTNHHLFQPLLYQVATGILSPGEIAPPTRDVLRRQANATVELGEVVEIDLDRREVTVVRPDARRTILPYDSLVVGVGVGQSYFGHDEFAEWAPGMKTLADALLQRQRIFSAFEMAGLEEDPEACRPWLTFVVVGGGPTGVEISGQIAELARRALKNNFRHFDPAEVKVVLFEGGKEILASFGDRLSAKATREIEKTGVTVHTGCVVTAIDADGVDVKEETAPSPGTGGIRSGRRRVGPPLAKKLPRAQRSIAREDQVERDCLRSPEVFVVGDAVNFDNLPGVAGSPDRRPPGKTIRRRLDGRTRSRSNTRPRKHGRHLEAACRRQLPRVAGFLGWLMWLFVHLAFLTGFKNRFKTIVSWTLSFLGTGRTERALIKLPERKSR